MAEYQITRLQDRPDLMEHAAEWFHQKWNIPKEVYLESMKECLKKHSAVPQWYVVLDGSSIIAGIGVIENDFHEGKDLTPNVCAVYVEKEYRCLGIAGEMLKFVCNEFKQKGIDTLYLVTEHRSFYERYGWEFLCMVKVEGEAAMTRMYVHKA